MSKQLRMVLAIIVGISVGLIPASSIVISIVSHRKINLLPIVYSLRKVIHFFAIGYLLTDFVILFMAGFLVSLISKQTGIKLLLFVGIATPVIATVSVNSGFLNSAFLTNIIMAIIYILIGGMFYQKLFNRIK